MIHTLARSGLRLQFLICCLLLAQPLSALGESLYRCDTNGVPEFRQTPCRDGRERRVQVIEASGGMIPSEPALRLEKKPTKQKKPAEVSRKPAETSNDRRCWRKRQQLERVERKLRSGYKASEYQSLHDRQREYEDYLRRFCR